jgi:hypothetical protein
MGDTAPSMEEAMPTVFGQFKTVVETLERHYRDMQDIEFTVEQGKLYMLQTRNGKRTAKAALKIAVDMAAEGLISREEAIGRVEPASLDQLLHPTIDPDRPPRRDRHRPAGQPRRGHRQDRLRQPTRPSRPPRPARASSWCARRPVPRTSTACTPPAASSPPAAA